MSFYNLRGRFQTAHKNKSAARHSKVYRSAKSMEAAIRSQNSLASRVRSADTLRGLLREWPAEAAAAKIATHGDQHHMTRPNDCPFEPAHEVGRPSRRRERWQKNRYKECLSELAQKSGRPSRRPERRQKNCYRKSAHLNPPRKSVALVSDQTRKQNDCLKKGPPQPAQIVTDPLGDQDRTDRKRFHLILHREESPVSRDPNPMRKGNQSCAHLNLRRK